MYMFLPLHVLRVDDVHDCRCQHFLYDTDARGGTINIQKDVV